MLHAPIGEGRRQRAVERDGGAPAHPHAPATAIAEACRGNQALLRGRSGQAKSRQVTTATLQRKRARDDASADCATASRGKAAPANTILQRALQSPGHPLGAEDRRFFNARFGSDFGDVRIHRDVEAAGAAKALGADAFTVGNHVVFGSERYAPRNPAGRQLLAHELTHVVQQRGSAGLQPGFAASPSSGALAVSKTDDPGELEAERNAAAIDGDAPLQVARTASGVQRAISKGCIAPSLVLSAPAASAFGTVAETLIEPDYIAQTGGVPFGDVFLDNPLGPISYIAFLKTHHPHLNVALLAAQIGLSGGVLVPDILDSRSHELYEIKPDSVSGRAAGRAKLAAIDAFMAFNSLPYVRGFTYTPTPSIPIPLAGAALAPFLGLPILLSCGIPVVSLSVTRTSSGLILYEICVEADFECWLKVLTLELMIVLIILAILAARGIPLPGPAPVPVPVIAGRLEAGAPESQDMPPQDDVGAAITAVSQTEESTPA